MDKTYQSIRSESKEFKEDNDCTVVATSVVTDIPYADAHALLKSAGRKRGRGFAVCKYHPVIRNLGFTIERITPTIRSKTVRTIERELAANWAGSKVLVNVRGHVLAWNGKEIVDWSAGRQHRILNVYLVYQGDHRPLNASCDPPKRKALKRPPMVRHKVWARSPDVSGFESWTQFNSVADAYRKMGLSLRGHQKVRKCLKRFGAWDIDAFKDNLGGRVYLELKLSNTDEA